MAGKNESAVHIQTLPMDSLNLPVNILDLPMDCLRQICTADFPTFMIARRVCRGLNAACRGVRVDRMRVTGFEIGLYILGIIVAKIDHAYSANNRLVLCCMNRRTIGTHSMCEGSIGETIGTYKIYTTDHKRELSSFAQFLRALE